MKELPKGPELRKLDFNGTPHIQKNTSNILKKAKLLLANFIFWGLILFVIISSIIHLFNDPLNFLVIYGVGAAILLTLRWAGNTIFNNSKNK